MCRAVVFKDGKRWRVRIVDLSTAKAFTYAYATEAEARAAAPKLRRQYERPVGKPMFEAMGDYKAKLQKKGNKPRSIETTLGRLADVFVDGAQVTGEVTAEAALAAWERFTTSPGRKSKRLPSVSTQANTLHEARTFAGFLLAKGWIKAPLLVGVSVEGRRKRRKPQLERREDSRRFKVVAIALGAKGDPGAVAAVSALLLGLRASEIANTTVSDLDDGGRIWIVREAKTEAGDRRLLVPGELQTLLVALAQGKPGPAKLFGDGVDRFWVRYAVRRVCRLAGVPVISPHGMRGTHATLAVAAGVSGLAVAASLGHESFAVTERHYATVDSVAGAQVERVLDALN